MVEPAVDIDQRMVARVAIITVEIPRGIFDADDIALAAADRALHRLGNDRISDGDGIVDVGLQERQQFRTVIIRIGLLGAAAIAGVADALHRIVVAHASRKRDRQQQCGSTFNRISKAQAQRRFPIDPSLSESNPSPAKMEFTC